MKKSLIVKFRRVISVLLTGILLTCSAVPWTAVDVSAATASSRVTVALLPRGLEEGADGVFQAQAGQTVESVYFSIGPEQSVSSVHFSISTPDLDLMAGEMTRGLETAWKISYPVLAEGINTVTVNVVGSDGSTLTESFQVRALENQGTSELDWEDTDSDQLSNWQEDAIGTDKENSDTDGDGLPDGYEVLITGTNPLLRDSDQNGRWDGEEDFDGDGLMNKEELEAQTNPYTADSDGDLLLDAGELKTGTNPLNGDTDYDGLSDGRELELGTDPLNPDSDGDGVLDGKESVEVMLEEPQSAESDQTHPSVRVEAPMSTADSVFMYRENPDTSIWAPKEMPGFLGAAYELVAEEGINGAEITFSFDPALKEREDFDPAIYYIDTENQVMVPLENQTVDMESCRVTADTNHFSMYALVDRHQRDLAFSEAILEGGDTPNAGIDAVFVLDESYSMETNDPQKVRAEVTRDFIDILRGEDRVGIIGFCYTSVVYHSLDTDHEGAKSSLSRLSNSKSGTSLSSGVRSGLAQFNTGGRRRAELKNRDAAPARTEVKTATPSEAEIATPPEAREYRAFQTATPSEALKPEIDWEEQAKEEEESLPELWERSAPTADSVGERMRMIVLLTDGEGDYSDTYTQQAIEGGIKIYTVGLGSSYNSALLQQIAEDTGGRAYRASDADSLIQEFSKLVEETVDISTDSDSDGLSDYHEDRIRLFNGVVIHLDPDNADTDGDGLKDGEEIIRRIDSEGHLYFQLLSYPNQSDSDGDGIGDREDDKPLRVTLGTERYFEEFKPRLKNLTKDYGTLYGANEALRRNRKAMDIMMDDLNDYGEASKVPEPYWDQYCSKFNHYVGLYGSVDEKVHYFRVKLNQAPETLEELLGQKENWELQSVGASRYHMFGEEGIYNLKFVTTDGKYEGVYNREGILLTEDNDAVNMGTYNYGDPHNLLEHYKLDVVTYYRWNNVSSLPGDGAYNSNKKANKNKDRYNQSEEAQKYRSEMKGRIDG